MTEYITANGIMAAELKAKRKTLGLSQREFAKLIGVSKPTIERWETSDRPIKGPIVLLMHLLTGKDIEAITIPERKTPVRLWYMYKDKVCTLIDVDERKEEVYIRNYVKSRQFKAFGINEDPSYEDYEEFLRSRCFPESRDKLKLILKELSLPFYDPFMIIEKTEGRMAEDDFWIKVEK